jgi:hypothetical protein
MEPSAFDKPTLLLRRAALTKAPRRRRMVNLLRGAIPAGRAQVLVPAAFQFKDAAQAVCNDGAGVESKEVMRG